MLLLSPIVPFRSVELDIKPEKTKKGKAKEPPAEEQAKQIAKPDDGGGFMRTTSDVEVRIIVPSTYTRIA